MSGERERALHLLSATQEARYRSPLNEVGVGANVGDYVFKIAGHELTGDDNVTELIKAADEKLYEAKRGGRNRVC